MAGGLVNEVGIGAVRRIGIMMLVSGVQSTVEETQVWIFGFLEFGRIWKWFSLQ